MTKLSPTDPTDPTDMHETIPNKVQTSEKMREPTSHKPRGRLAPQTKQEKRCHVEPRPSFLNFAWSDVFCLVTKHPVFCFDLQNCWVSGRFVVRDSGTVGFRAPRPFKTPRAKIGTEKSRQTAGFRDVLWSGTRELLGFRAPRPFQNAKSVVCLSVCLPARMCVCTCIRWLLYNLYQVTSRQTNPLTPLHTSVPARKRDSQIDPISSGTPRSCVSV